MFFNDIKNAIEWKLRYFISPEDSSGCLETSTLSTHYNLVKEGAPKEVHILGPILLTIRHSYKP